MENSRTTLAELLQKLPVRLLDGEMPSVFWGMAHKWWPNSKQARLQVVRQKITVIYIVCHFNGPFSCQLGYSGARVFFSVADVLTRWPKIAAVKQY